MERTTGLYANPRYFGYSGCEELFAGDTVKFKESGEEMTVKWWKARGCWAAYKRNGNHMIMLYKILGAIEKINKQ